MSGVLNDCDALLQGAGVRILNPKDAFINLTPSAPGFHVTAGGTVDIPVVTVTADLIALDGNVVFTAQGGTLSNTTARTVDVTYVNGTAVVTATVTTNGETFARSCVIPVMRDGAAGTPAYTWIKYADTAAGAGLSDDPAGKTYIGLAHNKSTATESTTPGDYVWSLLKGGDGQPGAKGADGVTYYTWIKYADQADGTGLYDAPNANTLYIGIAVNKTTATESTTKTDYVWSRFKGEQGVAGAPTYTWIKYADQADGTGLTDDPSGKAYIGLAYNKASATESTTATDYSWSLIKGTDGQPGGKGADGATLYTWIKYADVADGTGLYDTPTASTLYIGIATNKSTATESTVKTDYVWSKFKGDQGVQGPTTYTWVKYADSAAGAGLSDDPTGKAYIGFAYNKSTASESTTATDYTWSLIKGTDGQPGGKGADGQTLYTWIKYSDNADGTGLYDLPTASTQYLGIAVNKTTATESTTKTDYVWSKFRGADGVGTAGARGAGHYYVAGSSWSDVAAQAACPGGSVTNDVVTISSGTFVMEKRWTGSAWVDNGVVINGKLIVPDSILASSIDARGLVIRDAQGNIVISAGGLQPGFEAPGTKNSEAIAAAAADATTKAEAARVAAVNAAATYAQAQAGLAATNAAAYADGKVTAEEARAIADATAKAEAARVAAVNAAAADATAKANVAATTATYLKVPDTRDVNTPPSGYSVGHMKEFKAQSIIGVGASGYCIVETMKGWQDSSGGNAMQWAYISASEIYKRSAGGEAASWGAWVRDLDRAMYTGELDATKGANWATNLVGKPTSYRVVSRGNQTPAPNLDVGFYVDNTVAVYGGQRSYRLVVIRRSDRAILLSEWYDVYGAGQIANGRGAMQLAADMNAFGSDCVLVVYCYDEPKTNRMTGGLPAAMYRCGASSAVFGNESVVKLNSAYILVGIPGCGEGGAVIEAYQGDQNNSNTAWCDVGFTIDGLGNCIGTGVNNAKALNSVNTSLADKLSKSGTDVITGTIGLQSQFALLVGNYNDGIFVGSTGIYGRKGGYTQFSIGADGTAIFSGTLVAAGGIFKGDVLGGDYTGWSNPPGGQGKGGYCLSAANGLIMGSYNDDRYVAIYSNGEMIAPGFALVGGQLTLTNPIIVSPNISGANFNTFSVSIPGGGLVGSGGTGDRGFGSRSVSISGNYQGTLTYQWVIVSTNSANGRTHNVYFTSGTTSASVGVGGTSYGQNDVLYADIMCTVTDSNGVSKTATFGINQTFGSGAV